MMIIQPRLVWKVSFKILSCYFVVVRGGIQQRCCSIHIFCSLNIFHTPPPPHTRTGICKLCEEINLDPIEDVRVLVLLYKLGANKKPAEIQKEEWTAGCYALNLDSIDKFIKFIPQLDIGFMDREEFGDFYKVRV